MGPRISYLKGVRLSPDEKKYIASKVVVDGLSYNECAKKYGISIKSVWRYVRSVKTNQKIYGGIGGRPRALDEISIQNVKSIVTEVPSIREHDLRVFVREEYKETKKRKFPELEDTYIKCPNKRTVLRYTQKLLISAVNDVDAYNPFDVKFENIHDVFEFT